LNSELSGAEGVTQNSKLKTQNSFDVLDDIGSLIDKSLLRQVENDGEGEPHYSMLETIREYALEQFEASGEADILRDRHAAYFMKLAEVYEPLLTGATQKDCMEKLEREHDNFRAALKWCQSDNFGLPELGEAQEPADFELEDGDRSIRNPQSAIRNSAEVGLRMAGALGRFWSLRDHLVEGRGWLQIALAKVEDGEPSAYKTRALYASARIADNQGDYEAVRKFSRESLSIQETMNDRANMAGGYILLAKAASNEGDFEEARSLLEKGLEVAASVDDLHGLAHCLNGLGELDRLQGDYQAAKARYEECLVLFKQMGNVNGIGFSLHNLAYICMHEGEFGRANAMLDEALGLYKGLGNRLGIAMCVSALSGVALNAGALQRGARLLGAAQALLDSIGALLDPADLKEFAQNEQAARDKLGEAAFLASWAEGRAMTPEQVVAIEDTPGPDSVAKSAAREVAGSQVERARHSVTSSASPDTLSAREMDVLKLLSRGLSDADVAAQLYLSPHTVRAHIRSIYSKIGVASRSAATRYAADNNIM
jgi:DNA-binding CsgD family transcriptional regulator